MKKKLIKGLLLAIICATGCGKITQNTAKKNQNKTETKKFVEPNTTVGDLYFYVPKDFNYKPELRGLLYGENQKKVFIKGDYDNDRDNAIALVVYYEKMDKGSNQYTNEINAKLSDQDIKYSIKSNSKVVEIYARENYVIGNKVNYAYIMDKYGLIYVVNIQGPKDKTDEISNIVSDIHASLKL